MFIGIPIFIPIGIPIFIPIFIPCIIYIIMFYYYGFCIPIPIITYYIIFI